MKRPALTKIDLSIAKVLGLLPEELARLQLAHMLELEYRCEHCHRRPAMELFDKALVCTRCRRVLERKLVKHG